MKYLITTIAALTASTAAYAQDEAPNPFSGPRVEARIGFDHARLTLTATDGVDTFKESEGKSGVTYEGEIGYDLALSSISFIGVYAGVGGATTKDCVEVYGGDEACLKAGRNITAGVRGGYIVGKDAAIYVKGGYSNGRIRLTYEDPAFPADNFDLGENLDGFHAGAGVQVGVGSRAYAKLEYTYTDYEDFAYVDSPYRLSAGMSRHQIAAGLGIRF